jgi:hypothetical protein
VQRFHGYLAEDPAGDFTAADLGGAQVEPAAFAGEVEAEFVDEASADAIARQGSRAPDSAAAQAELGQPQLARQESTRVEGCFDSGGGEDLAAQPIDGKGDVIGRQREIGLNPQSPGAHVDALLSEGRGESVAEKIGKPGGPVEAHQPA